MNAGKALKREGQERSLWACTAQTRTDFLRIVAAAPPDAFVTVNQLRERLDQAQIPDRMRGGLMHAAVAYGLLDPVTVHIEDIGVVQVKVPSTGDSAHSAHVCLYQRTNRQLAQPAQPAAA